MANQETYPIFKNSETETEISDDGETHHSIKHKILDDDMVSFEKKYKQYLLKHHFKSKLTKFVLGSIPSFDNKIDFINKNVHENTFIKKWQD